MSEMVSIHWYRNEYEAVISYKISSGPSLALGRGYKQERTREIPVEKARPPWSVRGHAYAVPQSHSVPPPKCHLYGVRKRINVGGRACRTMPLQLQFQVAGQSYNPLQSDHSRAGQQVDAGYKQGTARANQIGQNSRCPEELIVLNALIPGQHRARACMG